MYPIPAPLRGPEIHKENLVVVVMNNLAQRLAATHQIECRELVLKDRALKMVPKPAHQIEDFPQPLVIRNVVTDQIGAAHSFFIQESWLLARAKFINLPTEIRLAVRT